MRYPEYHLMREPVLKPGSTEAVDAGCTCPVFDNRKGRGKWKDANGVTVWVISGDCPLHGSKEVSGEGPD